MSTQHLAIKVRDRDGVVTYREGTTEDLPDFSDLGVDVKIVEEEAVVVEGVVAPTYYVHINNVRVMAYPRTGRWTPIGDGLEVQLRVSYQRVKLPWIPSDRKKAVAMQTDGEICGNCPYFDGSQGQKEMMTPGAVFTGEVSADHWRMDVVDWIAEQLRIPALEVSDCGLCRKRDGMGFESDIGGLILPAKTPWCEMANESSEDQA